jgi:hypothetical protein
MKPWFRWPVAAVGALSCGGKTTTLPCEDQLSWAQAMAANALEQASWGCATDSDCEFPSIGLPCTIPSCWPRYAVNRARLADLQAANKACEDACRNCSCVEVDPQCPATDPVVFLPGCSGGQCTVVTTCDATHCPSVTQGTKCCTLPTGNCGADNGQGCVVTAGGTGGSGSGGTSHVGGSSAVVVVFELGGSSGARAGATGGAL